MATNAELETDYLVVGSGLAGMAFVDTLLDASDADVVMVDRRHAPGGHWLDAYPFVRLHQPSEWYGVGSTALDDDRREVDGPEQGYYSRVGGGDLVTYFDRVMRDRFLPSGRVRFLPMTEHLPPGRLRSLLGGRETTVHVRRAVVDATYTHSENPESYPPPFEVDVGARLLTPSALTRLRATPEAVVVIGTGKTAMDTVGWLLDVGCPPDRIVWVRTREAWLHNRRYLQPGELAGLTVEGTVCFLEALASASTTTEVYERLEADGVVLRIDRDVWPTVFRGPTISAHEVEQLRRVERVVRKGRVTRIGPGSMDLEEGSVELPEGAVYVHCAAPGLPRNPAVPVFGPGTITIQYLTRASMSLSSAAIARTECLDLSLEEKNRLCPAMPLPGTPREYLQMLLGGQATEHRWRSQPELASWFGSTRVNVTRSRNGSSPTSPALRARLQAAAGPAYERLDDLVRNDL
ncbi:NAD(P)-binding protein [Nocardioides coralli]|uniref:NAD(P)-binding protein n=1 Tax=Nocardioides coralli TaxID=2872154 RepID=UPI001CA413E4|nr:NAD(P)-binding protein [Nocardioides coralli]QZY27876.1 NAD(P)-binding protein [Nocardioides coralli]